MRGKGAKRRRDADIWRSGRSRGNGILQAALGVGG